MPDIAMCANPNCPLAVDCYRSTKSGTKPSEFRQAYSPFQWEENEVGVPHCKDFWANPYKAEKKGKKS